MPANYIEYLFIRKDYVRWEFDVACVSVGEIRHHIIDTYRCTDDLILTPESSDPSQPSQPYTDDTVGVMPKTRIRVRRAPKSIRFGTSVLVGATPLPKQTQASGQQLALAGYVGAQDQAAAQAEAEDAEFGPDILPRPARPGAPAIAQTQAMFGPDVDMSALPPMPRAPGKKAPQPWFVCPRCKIQGHHWENECPTFYDPAFDVRCVRRPQGIPSNKIKEDYENGGLWLRDGRIGTLQTNQAAFQALRDQMLGLSVQQPQALAINEVLAIEAPPPREDKPQTPRASPGNPGHPKDAAATTLTSSEPNQQAKPTEDAPVGAPRVVEPAPVYVPSQVPPQQSACVPSQAPAESTPVPSHALFFTNDDDQILQAATTHVKLSGPNALAMSAHNPATLTKAPYTHVPSPSSHDQRPSHYTNLTNPSKTVLPTSEHVISGHKRPLFKSQAEFEKYAPFLEDLPRAPMPALLRAFANGPLTRSEYEQLVSELRAETDTTRDCTTVKEKVRKIGVMEQSREVVSPDPQKPSSERKRSRDGHMDTDAPMEQRKSPRTDMQKEIKAGKVPASLGDWPPCQRRTRIRRTSSVDTKSSGQTTKARSSGPQAPTVAGALSKPRMSAESLAVTSSRVQKPSKGGSRGGGNGVRPGAAAPGGLFVKALRDLARGRA